MKPTFEGTYYRRWSIGRSITTLKFDPAGILQLLNLPVLSVTFTNRRRLYTNVPIRFVSCVATIGSEVCNSCVVCANEASFIYDCTNVKLFDILDLVEVGYPSPIACIGVIPGATSNFTEDDVFYDDYYDDDG